MTILQAAQSGTVFEAAQAYLRAGVSIIPLKGKLSSLKSWGMAQQYRASQKVVSQWHTAGLLGGVGIVCGAVSGNLVVLDFDSHEAVAEFEETFPTLCETLVISSGSRRGRHYYFYVDELPASLLVKNHELRANGMYVVGSPSPHPSGNRYEVMRPCGVQRLHHMRPVVEWIKSKRPAPITPLNPAPMPKHTGGPLSREAYFARRYVETALNRQITYLSHAAAGNRNNHLYWSAHALGQLVGSGALQRSHVEIELLNTARRIGLPDTESIATIRSGLNAGEQRPRRIPGPPPHRSTK